MFLDRKKTDIRLIPGFIQPYKYLHRSPALSVEYISEKMPCACASEEK